jgi:nucleolar protein 14
VPEEGGEEDSDEEDESDDTEAADDDELRQAFKEKARSIARSGDLRHGKRRLRRLGLLEDGGSQSSDPEPSDSEDESEDEGDEEDQLEAEITAADDEPEAASPIKPVLQATARVRRVPAAVMIKELPYVFEAPESHAQFFELVDGRSADDLSHVISRITTCHSISLSSENRRKMQIFFGVLLVHLEVLALQAPLPRRHLDVLIPHLLSLSREVPFFAATAARARLAQAQLALASTQPGCAPEWPSPGQLLLLRLFSLMFPASDFRHPVLTGAALLLGQYLARCEVRSPRDAAVGVIVAALGVRLASASQRYVPEALSFLATLVHSSASHDAAFDGLPAYSAQQFGGPWLYTTAAAAAAAQPLSLSRVLHSDVGDPWFQSAPMHASALCAALHVLSCAAACACSLPAAGALLAPARAAVARLQAAPFAQPALQGAMGAAAMSVAAVCKRAASAAHPPLQLHTRKPEPIKAYNPRFEEDGFVKGRDYDVDRERSDARHLKKMVAREAKGAARELRKDNRFLAEERSRVRSADDAERDVKYRSAMSWLEQQEADFRSGGQRKTEK